MECYVGLDVHSKASVFVMQDGRGQVMAQGEMPTTPEGFGRWHEATRLPAGTPVALETGTVAFFVARELTGLGCAPIAVAHRLARITFAMLRDGTDFDVGKLNVEEGLFERTIIRRYRLKQGVARP